MSYNIPQVLSKASWASLIFQLILVSVIIYIFYQFDQELYFLEGSFTYSFLAISLRNILAKDHRRSIKLIRQHKFSEAIDFSQKSIEYFNRNPWIDKYRFLTLLSATGNSYKEMGLCNLAFCYAQLNKGEMAEFYYRKVLSEFPNNGLAISGLNMIMSNQKPEMSKAKIAAIKKGRINN